MTREQEEQLLDDPQPAISYAKPHPAAIRAADAILQYAQDNMNARPVGAANRAREIAAIIDAELGLSEVEVKLKTISQLPGELNFNNFTDDEVFDLNGAFIEAKDIARQAIAKLHGESK